MTDPITITIAAAIFGVPNAIAVTHSIVRWVRPYADTPSPCERDEDRAAHRNPKLNRAVSPVGSVHHHHGSVSK